MQALVLVLAIQDDLQYRRLTWTDKHWLARERHSFREPFSGALLDFRDWPRRSKSYALPKGVDLVIAPIRLQEGQYEAPKLMR